MTGVRVSFLTTTGRLVLPPQRPFESRHALVSGPFGLQMMPRGTEQYHVVGQVRLVAARKEVAVAIGYHVVAHIILLRPAHDATVLFGGLVIKIGRIIAGGWIVRTVPLLFFRFGFVWLKQKLNAGRLIIVVRRGVVPFLLPVIFRRFPPRGQLLANVPVGFFFGNGAQEGSGRIVHSYVVVHGFLHGEHGQELLAAGFLVELALQMLWEYNVIAWRSIAKIGVGVGL
mmetsp:Transcript_21195/g.58665  ORF Transcript_21195/g.58665 Transcript_21195/m.58665 type:complete len:228 (-) Transcript_21195:165-848(-)